MNILNRILSLLRKKPTTKVSISQGPSYADKMEIQKLNPRSNEQLVAEYNHRNPDQFTTVKYMTSNQVLDYILGFDPYNNPKFEQFWLETDKYFGMVEESELEVLGYLHPNLREITPARKKILAPGEYEAFATFGFGPEYTGVDLGTWLSLKNMMPFFKNYGPAIIMDDEFTSNKNIKYGIDGAYFMICLNKKFVKDDVLTADLKNCPNIIILNTPYNVVVNKNNMNYEYWLHIVRIVTDNPNVFIDHKYLVPGTRFYKV